MLYWDSACISFVWPFSTMVNAFLGSGVCPVHVSRGFVSEWGIQYIFGYLHVLNTTKRESQGRFRLLLVRKLLCLITLILKDERHRQIVADRIERVGMKALIEMGLNTGKAKTALRTKRTLMRSTTHELYVPHYQAWSVFGAWMLSIITHRKFPRNICYAEGHILVMAKGTDRILCRVSVDNNPLTRRAAIRPFRTSHWLASRQNIFVTWPSPSSAHRKEPINSCWMDGRKNECKHMEWRKLNPLNRLVGD